jgi:hypothetical protein
MSTPDKVPSDLVAGDLWVWTRDLSTDYPAATWSGVWYFENAYKTFNVAATATGNVFNASIAAATSAAYRAGRYRWQFVVTSGSTRKTAETGWVEVAPDPAAAGNLDRRTHARRVLDAIEATIEGRASNDQVSMSIAGRSISRTPMTELITLRDKYRQFVADEESADDVAAGLGSKKRVFIRLSRG